MPLFILKLSKNKIKLIVTFINCKGKEERKKNTTLSDHSMKKNKENITPCPNYFSILLHEQIQVFQFPTLSQLRCSMTETSKVVMVIFSDDGQSLVTTICSHSQLCSFLLSLSFFVVGEWIHLHEMCCKTYIGINLLAFVLCFPPQFPVNLA